MEKYFAGYQITDHMHIDGSHFALGHNPKASAPFAVWQTNEDLSEFQWGRYFAHRHAAVADMVLRSTYQLQRPDGIPLSIDFLADNARESLQMQFFNNAAAEKIQETLSDMLIDYNTKLSAEELMQNPEFARKALDGYDNIDRSDENFLLRHVLRDILDENPRFLRPKRAKSPLSSQIQAASTKHPHTAEEHKQASEMSR